MLKMDNLIKYNLFGLVVLLTFILSACGTPENNSSTSAPVIRYSLSDIVELGKVPADRSKLKGIAKEVFSYYTNIDSPEVVAKYVKTNGTGDGSSWTNAFDHITNVLKNITSASDSKIYLVLVASGEYPSDRIAMKNSVAIIGGWNPEVEWEREGETRFDGQGKNMVFYNNSNSLNRTALLYGATITNGTAITSVICVDVNTRCGAGMFNYYSSPSLNKVVFSGNKAGGFGGGMYNDYSSPSLNKVVFSGNTSEKKGGGMYNHKSSPTLKDVTFSKNIADFSGGGMYNDYSSPSLVKVTFLGNKVIASVSYRSAVYGGGMANNYSSPTLENVTFSENIAEGPVGATGGGMANDYSSPTLKDVTFSGNETIDGGGMYNSGSSPSLENVTFSENKASRQGGGMYNISSSSPSLTNVTFSENTAESSGGGMYNHVSSSPTLVKVTFSRNTATTSGGGMFNQNAYPSLAKVTFSGNEATDGGGMYIDKSSPILVNVTFSENKANSKGGGVYVKIIPGNPEYDLNKDTLGEGPLLVNTIFWGNLTKGVANQIWFSNSTEKLGLRLHYSIIQGGTNDLGTEASLTGSDTTEGDPLLSPLADNGGFIQTHALGNNSPSINKGVYVKKSGDNFYFSQDNTTWYTVFDNNGLKTTATPPSDAEDLTATDARGYTRKGRPDIGAYEYGATP